MKTSSIFAPIIVAMLASISCDKITVGNSLKRSDTLRKEGSRGGADLPSGAFLTAVDFDGDYDWRKDIDYGRAKGKILLFRGEDIILSLNAGGDSGISTAADLHHFSGGHIYTEYFDGTCTIYKRDGEECLKAEGKETVKGILTREGILYVLSEKFPDRGFVLREDWKDVMSTKSGKVHGCTTDPAFGRTGALYEDKGAVCFIYSKTNGGAGQWFIVTDGEEKEVPLQASITKVFDLRCFNGSNSMVTEYTDGRAPVLLTGGRVYDLSKTLAGTKPASDYRLYHEDGRVILTGTFGDRQTGIWYLRELSRTLNGDCSLRYGEGYISRTGGIVENICPDGKSIIPLPKRYRVMMPGCVDWKAGSPAVALTPENRGDKPAIWENGILKEYDFNGYFTSVTKTD